MPANAVTRRPRLAQLKAIMRVAPPTFEAVAIDRDKRRSTRRRRLHDATAVGLAVAAMLAIASTAGADGWEIVPTPNAPGWPSTDLNGVSCTSSSSCTAVGTTTGARGGGQGISEAWTGASWNLAFGQTLAGNANNDFSSVSCISSTDCEAVGFYVDISGQQTPLAEGWNGNSWAAQPITLPNGSGSFDAVSCTLASACVAVGQYIDSGGVQRPLFESWNGTRWQMQPGFEAGNANLNAVSCNAPSACLAVGQIDGHAFAERWNGIAWDSESPTPPSTGQSSLSGISCLDAVYCVAVGNYQGADRQTSTFAELSRGSNQWSLLNTVNPSSEGSFLWGVSCTRGSILSIFGVTCQAIGDEDSSAGIFTQAEAWNGRDWSYEIPGGTALGTDDFLLGVSCHSTPSCTAVGYSAPITGGNFSTLAEQLTGGSGPHGLSLTRHGQVLALLRKPRNLELLVFKLGRHGRLLGVVALGQHRKGRSLIRWNMRVAGRRLAAGTYMAELVAALGRGATSDGPSVTFKLTFPTGPIRVQSSTCSVAAASLGRC